MRKINRVGLGGLGVSESMPSSKRVVRAFTKKVILEQRLEEVEDKDIWDDMFKAERRASAKALR